MADHPPDRHQDQPLHRKVQQDRRQDRESGRQQQQPDAIVDHSRTKRHRFHGDLDQLTSLVDGGTDHADHLVAAVQQRAKRVVDGLGNAVFAQVVSLGDRTGDARRQDQLPDVVAAQDDVQDPGILQQFRLQVVGQ